MTFFTIPSFIVDNKELTVAEKFLYSYFHTHHVNGNDIFVSNENLSNMLNCKTRQLQNLLSSLEVKKYISRTERLIKGKIRRIIKPLMFKEGNITTDDITQDVENNTHAENCTHDVQKNAPQACNNLHTEIKEESKEERKASSSFQYDIGELHAYGFTQENTASLLAIIPHAKESDLQRYLNYYAHDLRLGNKKAKKPVSYFKRILIDEGSYPPPVGFKTPEQIEAQKNEQAQKVLELQKREQERKRDEDIKVQFNIWKETGLTEELKQRIESKPHAQAALAKQTLHVAIQQVKKMLYLEYFARNVYNN